MAHKAQHTESTVLSFHDNIKEAAKKNLAFRQTVCKGAFSELVVISIPPTGELGEGVHDDTDVIMFIVEGKGEVIFGARKEIANKHDAILVTAGRLHNLKNIGRHDLKLFAVFLRHPPARKPAFTESVPRRRKNNLGTRGNSKTKELIRKHLRRR